ncbi:hypothetical protein AB0C69_10955 [Actinomadura sp. NPDC048032]|uniref:hypothetical protein n=1 Tax=Actinomadura sp. NPDC048032 TaxID=3155747 RepID=UPI0033C3B42E
MTDQQLCHCGAPARDAVLCVSCAYKLDDAIQQISRYQGLGYDLDVAMSRQARINRRPGRPKAEDRDERFAPGTLQPQPLPYDPHVSVAAAEVRRLLRILAVDVIAHETRADLPTDQSVTGLAAWIRPRVGWLRHHHRAPEYLDIALEAARVARRAVDRPAELLFAGPCDECGEDMYAHPAAAYVECTHCDLVYEVTDRRAWLLRSAEDTLATTTEIARAISAYGQPLTPEAIRGYVHRGMLIPHGTRNVGRKTVPLYRLGDVLDLLAARAAKEGKATA